MFDVNWAGDKSGSI